MHIDKIIIENFKSYEGIFSMTFNKGLNILVGDNEVGKSTILEAINLTLSGWIGGKHLRNELSQSLFNNNIIKSYLESLSTGNKLLPPPSISIELFFEILEDDSLKALFEGTGNSLKETACGIKLKISFNDKYKNEYIALVRNGDPITSLPIEYYDYTWHSFARDDNISPKTFPIKSALIDSSGSRYQNGSDIYISHIVSDFLSDADKVRVSQAHRKMKESFTGDDAIININQSIKTAINISNKRIELLADVGTKTAWETSLMTYLNDVPFHNIGKGEQCLVKTKLALAHKKAKEANVLLLEEPENHLSHSKLNELISHISDSNNDKQIIISTHSSFVANKLGLGSLIFLTNDDETGKKKEFRIANLDPETKSYFQKLPGYDTLRLILCKRAILVEGDCDELVVQKAYMNSNKGRLPIQNGIDIISVRGLSFKRFLNIAKELNQPTIVITDNDGDYQKNIIEKYKDYFKYPSIKVYASNDNKFNTLEPQIVKANIDQLELLREVLGINSKDYPDDKAIIDYMTMTHNKTQCALKIFDTDKDIKFPSYILDAINTHE